MRKKILAVVLAVLMIISVLPAAVFAEDTDVCPGKGKAHTVDNCTSAVVAVVAGNCAEGDRHEDGYTLYACAVCGDYFIGNVVEAAHVWETVEPAAKDATCEEAGVKETLKCKVCGEVKGGEEIPALGHKYVLVSSTGDCEHAGANIYRCERCKKEITEVVEGKGHKWSEHPTSVKKEPTHTETGIAVYTCTNKGCTETKEVVIEKLPAGHVGVEHKRVDPTCAKTGMKAYWECACGKVFSDKECTEEVTRESLVIEVSSSHKLTKTPAKAATCDKAGNKDYWTCSECGKIWLNDKGTGDSVEQKDTVIPATGHDWSTDPVKIVLPTCTTKGFKLFKCNTCGAFEQRDEKPATNHKGTTTFTVTKEATCTENGEKSVKCTACGETWLEPIPATNHANKTIKATEAATCTKEGKTTFKCPDCEKTWTETIPATGHRFTLVEEKAATCLAAGYKKFKCAAAGCAETKVEQIPATGHHFTEFVEKKAATCVTEGYKEFKCADCDETSKEVSAVVSVREYTAIDDARKDHQGLAAQPIKTVSGTCSASGCMEYLCHDCGDVVTITLEKDENNHGWRNVSETKPTCTEDGTRKYQICQYCGRVKFGGQIYDLADEAQAKDFEGAILISRLNHSMRDADARKANCEEFGYTHRVCTNDGCTYEYITDYVPATVHVWVDDAVNSEAATCTKDGVDVKYCANPGCKETIRTVIPALGHVNAKGEVLADSCTDAATDRKCVHEGCNYAGGIVPQSHKAVKNITIPATCQEYKREVEMCSDCGKVLSTKTFESEGKAGHSYGEWTITKQPTAKTEGEKERVCSVCGDKQTEAIAKTASIKASFEVSNNANAAAGFTDSALVAVKVVLNTVDETADVWGMGFEVKYDKKLVSFEGAEALNEKLNTNFIAHDNKEGGFVKLFAQAPNAADKTAKNATLEGKEEFAVLYFRIINCKLEGKDTAKADFSFGQIEALTYDSVALRVEKESASIKINKFMDANGDGDITMEDLLLLYKMTIGEVETTYDAVVDINKDGEIDMADLLALYEYYVGAKSYEDMIALGLEKD